MIFSFFLFSFRYLPLGLIPYQDLWRFETKTLKFQEGTYHLHYHPQESPYFAQRALQIIEKDIPRINDYFGYYPKRVNFTVVHNSKMFNGFATTIPENLSFLYNYPPSPNSALMGGSKDWIRQLIIHEYTHINTLDGAENFLKIFGSIKNILNFLSPRFLIEGIATWAESYFFEEGRLNDPLVIKQFQEIMSQFSFKDLDNIDSYPFSHWNNFAYTFGGFFFRYMENKKPKGLSCLYKEFKKVIFTKTKEPFYKCFHQHYEDALHEFVMTYPKKEGDSLYPYVDFMVGGIIQNDTLYYAYRDPSDIQYTKEFATHRVAAENLKTGEVKKYTFNYIVEGIETYQDDVVIKLIKDSFHPLKTTGYSLKENRFLKGDVFYKNEAYFYKNEQFSSATDQLPPLARANDRSVKEPIFSQPIERNPKYNPLNHLKFNSWLPLMSLTGRDILGLNFYTAFTDPLNIIFTEITLGAFIDFHHKKIKPSFNWNNIVKIPLVDFHFGFVNTINPYSLEMNTKQIIKLGLSRSDLIHSYGVDTYYNFENFNKHKKNYFTPFYKFIYNTKKIESWFNGFSIGFNSYHQFDFKESSVSFIFNQSYSKKRISLNFPTFAYYSYYETNFEESFDLFNVKSFNTLSSENKKNFSLYLNQRIDFEYLLTNFNSGLSSGIIFFKNLSFFNGYSFSVFFNNNKSFHAKEDVTVYIDYGLKFVLKSFVAEFPFKIGVSTKIYPANNNEIKLIIGL